MGKKTKHFVWTENELCDVAMLLDLFMNYLNDLWWQILQMQHSEMSLWQGSEHSSIVFAKPACVSNAENIKRS